MRRLVVVVVMALVLGQSGWTASGKIGVVYLRKVFSSYEKTKQYDQQLNKQAKEVEKRKAELEKEIQKLQAALEVVGDKEKEKKIQEIRKKQMELRNYVMENVRVIGRERDRYMREILQDIKPVVTKYAQDNGYDIILNGDMLLYSSGAYDVTDKIVEILNSNYKKGKE